MVEILNAIILVLFTGGMLATTLAIGNRLIQYKRQGLKAPLLAKRDMFLAAGLAWPFFLILLVRALGAAEQVAGTLWWTLITGVPAVLGVLQFTFIEYFVIERTDSKGYLAYLTQAQEEKDGRTEE